MWIKKIQPGFSGKAGQREKLEMWRRDAAENANLQASYVILTVRLVSEAGALQESSVDASVRERGGEEKGGGGMGGYAQGRERFLGGNWQVSNIIIMPFFFA